MKKKVPLYSLLKILQKYWPLIVLFLFWFAIVVTNFKPHTWLSGWDNLHPEFNFSLNIKRALSAPWEEYQGLGLLGGMAHAADLTRQVMLWPVSLFISPEYIRYFWMFLMMLTGSLGTFFLSKELLEQTVTQSKLHLHESRVQKKHFPLKTIFYFFQQQPKHVELTIQCAALAAGAFYLFNLSTIQNFYATYESFSSFYGCIPWLLCSAIRYLRTQRSKELKFFALISLLSTSAFYVQTFFVVFIAILGVFCLDTLITEKKEGLLSICKLLLTVFIINSFWLLPVGYFTLTNSQLTVDAHQNQIATQEVSYMNQGFGTFSNILHLKGFWFDYIDFGPNNSYYYLLQPWREFTNLLPIQIIEIVLIALILLGFVFGAFQQKFKRTLLVSSLLCVFMLTSGHGLLGLLYTWMSNHLPLFGQMFRSAFTKWSVMTSLFFALSLSSFIYFISSWKTKISKAILICSTSLILGLTVISVWPIFRGQLIYAPMRTQIPSEYFDLMDYFKNQPKQSKVVFLPAQSQWGWNFYSWNYRGSGFLWYGIEQPILDRAFDVWSKKNEDFYYQLSTAIDDKDAESLKRLFEIYGVNYAIVDNSVIAPQKPVESLQFETLNQLMSKIGAKKVFHQGNLDAFLISSSSGFINSPKEYGNSSDTFNSARNLNQFQQQKDWIDDPTSQNVIQHPFDKLSGRSLPAISYLENGYSFEIPVSLTHKSQSLNVAPLTEGEQYTTQVKVSFSNHTLHLNFPLKTTLSIGNQEVELPVLPNKSVVIPGSKDSVYIQFNQKEYLITENNPLLLEAAFQVGEEEDFIAFNPADTQLQGSEPIIEQKKTIKLSVDRQDWQPFLTPTVLPIPEMNDSHPKIKVSAIMIPYQYPAVRGNYKRECDIFHRGTTSTQFNTTNLYSAQNFGAVCDAIPMLNLNTNMSYLMRIKGQNNSGRSLRFYLQNISTNQPDLEEILPKKYYDVSYSLLPWELPNSEKGYTITFENRSIGGERSENQLDTVTVMPLDLQRLSSVNIVTQDLQFKHNDLKILKSEKIVTFLYDIQVESSSADSLFTLSQSFDHGWIALNVKDYKLLKHVQFDGWANGWIVSGSGEQEIVILYWPQLLEFAGFGVMLLTTLYFLLRKFLPH